MNHGVSALYVDPRGPYPAIVADCWDEARDARSYAGPNPVVAHPPCERWGRYWSGGPMLARTPKAKTKGDDAGCFAAAIAAVRRWGGVLEHPEASHAWLAFGLLAPRLGFGWEPAGDWLGWTCRVEQGHYGHAARKATWLYAVGVPCLPRMPWGTSGTRSRLDDGFHSKEERRKHSRLGVVSRLSRLSRRLSPAPFATLMVEMATTVRES